MAAAARVEARLGTGGYTQAVASILVLRNGFAWWLPLVTAALSTLIAVLLTQSSVAAWDADVHLWARDGRTPTEYANLVLDPSVQGTATNGMMASYDGRPQIDGVSVELNETLIRVTVRSPRGRDAEALALALAHAAIDESRQRFGDESGLDLLGLVQPGARKVASSTNWSAAWASAVGLLLGLGLAATTARVASRPRTVLGRIGRLGLRPIAAITSDAERDASRDSHATAGVTVDATGAPRGARDQGDGALLLANALSAERGVVALVPLDEASAVNATLIQAARVLAARGDSVIWLDGRRPAFELEYGVPPPWLAGGAWSPLTRSELMRRAAARALRPNGQVLTPTDPLPDASALAFARSAVGVILLARADALDDELGSVVDSLGPARLLGVALTRATADDVREFELAQTTE